MDAELWMLSHATVLDYRIISGDGHHTGIAWGQWWVQLWPWVDGANNSDHRNSWKDHPSANNILAS